jgi:SAM-dependent methyltransferase
MGAYFGRPSISPVIAGLFAAGLIKKRHAVLDAGCGTGTDCLTLASWGVRRVVGIDDENADLARAHERLVRLHRKRGIYAQRVEWHFASVTERHACFPNRTFDVVLDSLLFNNLSPRAGAAYLRQLARITKPGALLVMQYRSDDPKYGRVSRRVMPQTFHRYFSPGDLVTTDLVEYASSTGSAKRVRVTVVIGRRRGRAIS